MTQSRLPGRSKASLNKRREKGVHVTSIEGLKNEEAEDVGEVDENEAT
jgi:hypothetical protein